MTTVRTKSERRFLRFSVRTLLIVLTILCIWLGWKVERARRQREAVAFVHEMGGSVNYDYEVDNDGRFAPNAEPPGPKWLRRQLGVDFFDDVILARLVEAEVSDITPLSGLETRHPDNGVMFRYLRVAKVQPLEPCQPRQRRYVRDLRAPKVQPFETRHPRQWRYVTHLRAAKVNFWRLVIPENGVTSLTCVWPRCNSWRLVIPDNGVMSLTSASTSRARITSSKKSTPSCLLNHLGPGGSALGANLPSLSTS